MSDPGLEALAARGIAIDAEAFASWRAGRASGARLYELGLVWACLRHDRKALQLLESDYLPQAARALTRLRLDAASADDVMGWLRAELFAREDGPMLERWSGRGDLAGWLRAIALHEGLKRLEQGRKSVALDDASLPLPDPALAALKGTHREAFTRALVSSFEALSLEQRNVLRQYLLDGLTIDQLGVVLGVHRATAARRVQAAREALVSSVKAQLMQVLSVGEQSVEEVITLSNLDASLSQLLRQRPSDGEKAR